MVSLSFKSLESYISEDNLTGLQSFLASRSVVIDDKDENGSTALILAASKGKPEFCKELLLHGADVNAEDNVRAVLDFIHSVFLFFYFIYITKCVYSVRYQFASARLAVSIQLRFV